MEIQQHDGVVVEVAGISAGLRQALNGGGEVLGRGGVAPSMLFLCAALPSPLYL